MILTVRVAAAAMLIALVVVTIAPIGFRPSTNASPDFERFAAFAIVGGLFAAGYPRRAFVVMVSLLLLAGILELAQNFTATRHGHIADFLSKALGGICGVVACEAGRKIVNALAPGKASN